MRTFDEESCLEYNPFEGDFGSPSDRILTDKIVTARKSRKCDICLELIQPKERIRVLTAIFDGGMMWYSWCSECCHGMAQWESDCHSESYIESRYRLGRESFEKSQNIS